MKSRLVVLVVAPVALMAVVALSGLPNLAPPASAQSGTGVITGRVVWNSPMPVAYGVAPSGSASAPDAGLETAPEVTPEEITPEEVTPPEAQAMPGSGIQVYPVPRPPIPIRPPTPRLIPAGAVVVAVQGTSLMATTGGDGRFEIHGVPVGQYLTVAAGPVPGTSTAFVLRPNVLVKGDTQRVSLGTLYLGQPYYSYGPVPYAGSAAPGEEPNTSMPEPDQVP